MAYLVLIETTGNQHYIFNTNRLRENAGASEIVFRAGTSLVVEAIGEVVEKVAGQDNPYGVLKEKETTKDRVEAIREIGEKTGADSALAKCGVEIIVSTSGKALLLVNDRNIGEDIIWHVTRKALEEFPGLAMLGIVGKSDIELPGNNNLADAHQAIKDIHEDIEKLRSKLPSPLARFPTMPFLQPCDSSGLPANELRKSENDPADNGAFSSVTLKKRDMRPDAHLRIGEDTGVNNLANSPKVLDRLRREGKLDWVAIVHADGNGFGGLFLNFGEKAKKAGRTTAREYFKLLRRFSCSLELCGLFSFAKAAMVVEDLEVESGKKAKHNKKTETFKPIVPLILGGDDLTVVMDGRQALKFTVEYQRAFEEATIADDHNGVANAIKEVINGKEVTNCKVLGSGAGVAIVKPHYPFHRAYELAESLIKSAKKSKSILGSKTEPENAVSALDFHILFDNGATNLEELREKMIVNKPAKDDGESSEQPANSQEKPAEKCNLTMRPYVVSDNAEENAKQNKCWIKPRKWDDLRAMAKDLAGAMKEQDKVNGGRERAPLPSSQLHMLREALHKGENAANSRYKLIKHRYSRLPSIDKDDASLFADNCETGERKMRATRLLDAMEVIDIEQLYHEEGE